MFVCELDNRSLATIRMERVNNASEMYPEISRSSMSLSVANNLIGQWEAYIDNLITNDEGTCISENSNTTVFVAVSQSLLFTVVGKWLLTGTERMFD
jgi:hypothetical protein